MDTITLDEVTPFHNAVEFASKEEVEYLILHGADINTEARYEEHYEGQCFVRWKTPLDIAKEKNATEKINMLLYYLDKLKKK